MKTQFNLQTFLSEMRDEQRADHVDLSRKIDALVTTVAQHDTRLVVIENTRKTMRWLAGTVIVAVLGGGIDLLYHVLTGGSK